MKQAPAVGEGQALEFGKMADRMAAEAAAEEDFRTSQGSAEPNESDCWTRSDDHRLVAVNVDQWISKASEQAEQSRDRLRLMSSLADLMRDAWDEVGLDLINATHAFPHMADRQRWRKAAGLDALDKESSTAARKWSRERHAIEPALTLGVTKVSPRNILAAYDRVKPSGDAPRQTYRKTYGHDAVPHEYDVAEVSWAHKNDIDQILAGAAKASVPAEGHRAPDEGLQVAMLEAALVKARENLRAAVAWADDGSASDSEPDHVRRARQWRVQHAPAFVRPV